MNRGPGNKTAPPSWPDPYIRCFPPVIANYNTKYNNMLKIIQLFNRQMRSWFSHLRHISFFLKIKYSCTYVGPALFRTWSSLCMIWHWCYVVSFNDVTPCSNSRVVVMVADGLAPTWPRHIIKPFDDTGQSAHIRSVLYQLMCNVHGNYTWGVTEFHSCNVNSLWSSDTKLGQHWLR